MGILELKKKVPSIAERLAGRDQKQVNASVKKAKGKKAKK